MDSSSIKPHDASTTKRPKLEMAAEDAISQSQSMEADLEDPSPPLRHFDLDGLPDELILCVFRCLENDPLAQLCLVSKRFCQIATECLYECIYQKHPEGPGHSIIKAIGELNPSLGQYVRSLSLERLDIRWIDEGADGWVYNERTRNLFACVLRSVINVQNINLGVPPDIDVARGNMAQDYDWVKVFDDAVRGCPGGLSQRFEQLTTLSIDADAVMHIQNISSVFMLPAIKFLSLWNLVELAPLRDWAVEQSSSTIKILKLNNCALHNRVVAQIVESLNSLESFDYTYTTEHVWSSVASASEPEEQLCWAEILRALSQHRPSLQSLGLGEFTYDEKEGGLLGCMKDFINLEQLRVELEMLVDLTIGDIDIGRTLPPDIKSLSLEFKAESRFASLYGPAFASLGGSVFKQNKKFLHIHANNSRMFLGSLQLSNHIKTLLDAGLITSLSEMEGDTRTECTLEQLLVAEDFIAFIERVFPDSIGDVI